MKKFGKRMLSMLLALGLTVSMPLSDLATVPVNAAGNEVLTQQGENGSVEMAAEDVTATAIPKHCSG